MLPMYRHVSYFQRLVARELMFLGFNEIALFSEIILVCLMTVDYTRTTSISKNIFVYILIVSEMRLNTIK